MKITLIFSLMFYCLCAYSQEELTAVADQEIGPCKKDIETLCPGVLPGKGAFKDCLKNNKDKLSAECKEKIEARKEKVKEKAKELKEVCSSEIEKFCKDVKKGKGKIIKCLKKNIDQEGFGAECKEKIESMKEFKRKKEA